MNIALLITIPIVNQQVAKNQFYKLVEFEMPKFSIETRISKGLKQVSAAMYQCTGYNDIFTCKLNKIVQQIGI